MAIDSKVLSQHDRVALVTGGAAGIGAAVARALGDFGARVAICDRDAAQLTQFTASLRDAGIEVEASALDVRDEVAREAFLARVVDRFGKVDLLVNNAGGTFHAPFDALSSGGERALIEVNFAAVSQWIRAVVPHMPPVRDAADDGPSIVNVSSIEAHRAAPGYAVYAAMKAAVENLTKSLALEFGDRGIRVNSVAPDMIPTPGSGEMEFDTPLARRGHVDDIAGAVLYLASPLAAFVTGTTLHVDGGTGAAGGWYRAGDGGFTLGPKPPRDAG